MMVHLFSKKFAKKLIANLPKRCLFDEVLLQICEEEITVTCIRSSQSNMMEYCRCTEEYLIRVVT